MKTLQEELKDRGYIALSASVTNPNDINIFNLSEMSNIADAPIVAEIKYSEVLQRNTAQEKLDFILSKLPKNE